MWGSLDASLKLGEIKPNKVKDALDDGMARARAAIRGELNVQGRNQTAAFHIMAGEAITELERTAQTLLDTIQAAKRELEK
ncbi:MAG: hypothetical protein J4432_01925 [DPANN group archaeon]|nr:hypothetical protein [DPANN group archaeon]